MFQSHNFQICQRAPFAGEPRSAAREVRIDGDHALTPLKASRGRQTGLEIRLQNLQCGAF